ncbi:MAG TPA: hypothetical protein VK694_04930 [Verrucomicrobiae bacterium]|nr:hypothetical protein [Verrucomicrobiae bacterium]
MNRRPRVWPLVVLLVLLATVATAYWQRLAIYDWQRLRGYEAPAEIATLATETTMNESARRLFYVHRPLLNDRTQFTQNCSDFGEHTIVLGCYVSQTGIYIFDVQDERLQGVEQVTAAHELLHAAYDRLDTSERTRIDELTEQVLTSLKDQRIKDTIENYRKRDPMVVSNELHSIIGTEVRELPEDLETYYKKYFNDRHVVVTYSEKYESVFTERKNKAEAIEQELQGLKTEIEQRQNTLEADRKGLDRDRSGARTEPQIDAFNARVTAYNADIRELNSMINHYNQLVEQYKAVSLETQELFKALDSRPTL